MNWQIPNQKSQHGFSLAEVLVAMAIVPMGLLGVAKFQSNMMINSAETKTRTEALYIAEQKIEDLKSFATSTVYSAINTGNDTVTANTGSNADLTRTWTVTNSTSPNYKTITVNVAWTGSDNVSNSVSLTSYVSLAEPVVSGQHVLADASASSSTPTPDPDSSPDPEPAPDPEPTPHPDPTPDPDPTADPDPTPDPDPTTYNITVSGFITYNGNGSKSWAVSLNGSLCDSGDNSSSYSCTVSGISSVETPIYAVSFTSSGTVCGTESVDKPFSISAPYATQNFVHAQNASKC